MSALTTLFQYIDENQDRYIKKLANWVAIQSVSAWPEKRGEIRRMMEAAAADIQQLGGSVELVDIGKQKLPDGSEIPLPPILLGKLGSDPRKKTVCVYGHLDVQPASLEDGWDSEPFTLTERDVQRVFHVSGRLGSGSRAVCRSVWRSREPPSLWKCAVHGVGLLSFPCYCCSFQNKVLS
ncbi:Hypothetical predicted protein [Marmota monax]|uniref:Peptidase M20 dimerisation domain-containing protein n=1 Tax=Marmota monax TaxID=9995 RepID=A0A5E4A4D5_MARMO|nr:Hypothetical predicted protein [Marmota monax]